MLSWNSYLGDINSGWFAETGNVAAGISDTVTMNLTHRIRQAGGFDNVNYNSGFYTAGQVIGTGINIGLGFGNPCALGSLGSFGLKFINGIQAVGGLVNAGENLSQGNFIAAGFDLLGVAGNVSQLGQSCFTGDTKLMARSAWREGWRRIDEIKVGDEVLSRHEDEPEGPLQWKRVEEVFERYGFVVDLYVGEQVIRTTTEHPFYARGKGWVEARGLERGDLLLSDRGQWVAVEEVRDSKDYVKLYNLRVAEWHTYFVGDVGWGFSVWGIMLVFTKVLKEIRWFMLESQILKVLRQ